MNVNRQRLGSNFDVNAFVLNNESRQNNLNQNNLNRNQLIDLLRQREIPEVPGVNDMDNDGDEVVFANGINGAPLDSVERISYILSNLGMMNIDNLNLNTRDGN